MSELSTGQQAGLLLGLGWLLAPRMGVNGDPEPRALHPPAGEPGLVHLMPQQCSESREVQEAPRRLASELALCRFYCWPEQVTAQI